MKHTELIKNFERIRSYMREFYLYGFKHRGEYDKKSARSYDNERRRIESYLGDYMGFHQTAAGKNVFLSIDSRSAAHNPLYKALKSKSFTDGDITLHFILLDILHTPGEWLTLTDITGKIDQEYLSGFRNPLLFDESTVRKKLKEYVELGLLRKEKRERTVFYTRCEGTDWSHLRDALEFFSETALCGVLGSYMLDALDEESPCFFYKHHYITQALESEVLCRILEAISDRETVVLKNCGRRSKRDVEEEVLPLRILGSVQNGRWYLMGYQTARDEMKVYRLDYIMAVKSGHFSEEFEELRSRALKLQEHIWGVVCREKEALETVEFTVRIGAGEDYIFERLEREKRCGTVKRLEDGSGQFTAEVYDSNELIPWIRTFLCRITAIHFSNEKVAKQWKRDVEAMYQLYGIGGED